MRLLLKAILVACGVSFASPAVAQTCEELAAPVQTATVGIAFDAIDPKKALSVCTAEVKANPDNHASLAHLARVYSKLDRADAAGELLRAIGDTGTPESHAHLGAISRDGRGGP